MDWIVSLFTESSIAHDVVVYSLVIALGVLLGKIKFFGISLGVTFVLFVGIVMSHFGFSIANATLLNFIRDFGLILFVFSIGMQVGPGFFSSFKKGGVQMNMLAVMVVLLNVVVALVIYYTCDVKIAQIVGILSGAVTNTPGLGAAQQALRHARPRNGRHGRRPLDGLCRCLSARCCRYHPVNDSAEGGVPRED